MSVNTKTYQTGKNHSQVVVDNIDEFPKVLVHAKVSVKIRHEISERLVVVENEGPGIVKISRARSRSGEARFECGSWGLGVNIVPGCWPRFSIAGAFRRSG